MRRVIIPVGLAFGLAALGGHTLPQSGVARAGDADAGRAAPPAFEGLGKHGRKVTTSVADAQRYFDQGLNLLFAFNHDEAIRSFEAAAARDPDCAMAYWGVAVANGPHINNAAVPPERSKAALAALGKARERAKPCTATEKALIDALGKRHADPQPDNRKPLDEAYAAAMRAVWKQFPDDADVGALFAESLMDLRPWNLWTPDGKPQPETPEILATLEKVLSQAPAHPLANHLYIHAVEASPTPGKADAAADRLRTVAPGLGHLVHMPSHIDIRRGRWQQAVETNERAVEVDRRYRALVPQQGFYRIYMAHNHHMLAFAAMMQGESGRALGAVRAMLAGIPKDWMERAENAPFADGLLAIPFEVQVRFGRWDEILAEPEPAKRFPTARAMRHSARAVALASRGRPAEARESQKAFREAATKVPKFARMGSNRSVDVLAVADAQLEGEILFREGKVKEALASLRDAAAKEDKLTYDEPPDWTNPVRHALGASLLKAGEPAEAERVYRDDLRHWPENGWSLYGLARSLEAQGKKAEAAEVKERFERVWQRADVKLTSSCFCQPGNP
jgi:tetratricopeptide (TPR) repeat protein